MLESCHTEGVAEAGCDEAGRGCLAGPVFAAAVVLPYGFRHPMLDDSKKLTPLKREVLREVIEAEALAYGVARVDPQEIDRINILNASILAMHRALDQLAPSPEHILVDGNRFRPYRDVPHLCVVGGDGKYASIAAASVLAKTLRDGFMAELHGEDPRYGWDANKGYPTRSHREALVRFGPSRYHRRSFRLQNVQLTMDFPGGPDNGR